MNTKNILSIAIAGLFAIMLIPANAAEVPINGIDGSIPTQATPTPCPPGWSAGAVFPAVAVVRAVGVYFPANGRFYSIGGRSADVAGADFTNPFEYNPATNTWVAKAAIFPDNKVDNMACGVLTVGGTPQIYCVGGNASQVVGNASRVFSYNPVTDTITALTAADDWPGSQAGTFLPGGFAVAGNKLYIIGTFNANSVPPVVTAQVWQFDPNAAVGSRWLARTDYPVARAYVPAATIGGFIYTGGGSNLDAGGLLIDTVDSFKYDPATGVWTAIANIPRATGETRAVVVNNQMWVLGGGRVAPNPSNEVDIYDPVSNTWSTGLPFSVGRRNFPADTDGSRVWLAGGYVLNNTMEVFGPDTCPTPTPTPGPPTPTPTPGGTATPTPTPGGTATPTPTPGGTPTPTPASQPINLSTRLRVQAGDNVGIGGFIITGSVPKQVLLRGIGPSLIPFGVPDALADPVMELHGPSPFVTIINDNWRDDPAQAILIKATGIPPTNDLESAIYATLAPGAYTAIVRGQNNGTGVALIEVYDLSATVLSKLGNISTRAFVGTGNDIVIAGFILGHSAGNDRIEVRGIGPSLANFGVPNPLANPKLELRDSNGALIGSNDDWQNGPPLVFGFPPSDPLEAAIEATLPPGAYTALLSGVNNGTGVGVVEVYDFGSGGGGGGTPTPTPGGGTPTPTPTPGGGTPTPTPTPGGGGTCTESFDGVTAPALPAGWVATNPDPGDGTLWVTSATTPDTAPNSAFIPDQDGISDKVLDSRPITISSAAAVISFRNYFNTEHDPPPAEVFWDGGVLEVSSPNISNGDFLDITDSHVGGSFVSGPYTGEIDGTAANPLAGRMAWSGDSGGYINSVINLGPNVSGQTIKLRFRMGSDEALARPGWNVDTISITDASCPP